MNIRAEVYQREDKLYDWRLISEGNNEVLGGSSQGFGERNDAREGLMRVIHAILADVVEIRDVENPK